MREIVIISGKGGTGKTSLAASFAILADRSVIADCDVDAADMHLILTPQEEECHEFFSGHEAVIDQEQCSRCGTCWSLCRFDAIGVRKDSDGGHRFFINPVACEGCGVCVGYCPEKAIEFPERLCGWWMVANTRAGRMVHARHKSGGENSGKLVTKVRNEAARIAGVEGNPLVIIDGPPGIGCPVIAALSGASLVVVVTEPSLAGKHDLLRVLVLIQHFQIPAVVCVNKWDINSDMTLGIEKATKACGLERPLRIRYDTSFTTTQLKNETVVESHSEAADDIRKVWNHLNTKSITAVPRVG